MSLDTATHIPCVMLGVCLIGKQSFACQKNHLKIYMVWRLLVLLVVLWGGDWSHRLPISALAQPRQVAALVHYQPPPDSQPGHRVMPEPVRGLAVKSRPTLVALVPDHIGRTVNEQPELYWYLSREVSYPVAVTLIDSQSPIPLLQLNFCNFIED
jgi:hypothetical protein